MEGLFGMVGMLLLAIMFIFTPVCFLIVNWGHRRNGTLFGFSVSTEIKVLMGITA